jgi:hypothetical protein
MGVNYCSMTPDTPNHYGAYDRKIFRSRMVDLVLTYENLKNDFSQLCNIPGMEARNLPYSNRTEQKAYKHFYKTIELISEIY